MPDLKTLLKEAAAQGATKEQLDVIYDAYQENVKKKAQPTVLKTGGQDSAIGFEAFQQFKPGVNKYIREPKPVEPKRFKEGPSAMTVAEAQKQKPVAFSAEAFKQEALKSPTSKGANVMTGLTSTASGFYRIPRLIYDTFAFP